MQRVNITTAKSHLSSLLREVEDNKQEIVIERAGKPIAKIIKYNTKNNISRIGALVGKIQIAKDFDDLPSDLEQAFGIKN